MNNYLLPRDFGAIFAPFFCLYNIGMEQGKKKSNLLGQILGLPQDANINYTFNPFDNSIMKISWNSPNDGKSNLVNLLMDWKPYTIKIKDNH